MTDLPEHSVVIIGAGPSGLTAAYTLAKGGVTPLILEQTDRVGGLMRSIPKGEYVLDIGRKEMYARIPEVVALWDELLGEDYREYPHRVGSLFDGRIVEISGRFRGILRGVPFPLLARGALSLAKGRLAGFVASPANYQDHWHHKVGAVFARMFAQGYWEKFRGMKWADMPLPERETGTTGNSFSQKAIGSALQLAGLSGRELDRGWRHPRLGTGQLFDRLHEEIRNQGGTVQFGTQVRRIEEQPDGTWRLDVVRSGRESSIVAEKVISSLSVETLSGQLFRGDKPLLRRASTPQNQVLLEKRHVLLVFLFLSAPPRFPHAWLEVNDPDMRCGRITNYAAFGGDMVPEGKTCLCVEFFCSEKDDLLAESDEAVTQEAVSECLQAGLLDKADLERSWVMRLARTNAAASWRELQSEERRELLEQLVPLKTFFHVNRPGSDWASLAGLFAGRAVLNGSRTDFEMRANPVQRLPELQVGGAATAKNNRASNKQTQPAQLRERVVAAIDGGECRRTVATRGVKRDSVWRILRREGLSFKKKPVRHRTGTRRHRP